MSLRTDIEATRDKALALLTNAHDYFAFTSGAWRTLEQRVERGAIQFTLVNSVTGTTVSESELMVRAQRYVSDELTASTLQQFVSIFEAFLSDLLRLWLVAHPRSLGRRQLTGEDILALPDKAAIVDTLVSKELATVLYDRPAQWFRYLHDRVALGVPTDAQIQQFAEVKATRDVLVHGQGLATAQYADKAGPLARVPVGDRLDVPAPYHHACWALLCQLTADIGTAMAERA